jgi:hypothetical protein
MIPVMRTGDLSRTTGIYRSDCECDVSVEVKRGSPFPTCPICKESVDWAFRHSTFKPEIPSREELAEPPPSREKRSP